MKPHLICCSAHSSNSLNLTKPLALFTLFFCLLSLLFLALTSNPTPTTTITPTPSPALTNNTLTLPQYPPISQAYLSTIPHSTTLRRRDLSRALQLISKSLASSAHTYHTCDYLTSSELLFLSKYVSMLEKSNLHSSQMRDSLRHMIESLIQERTLSNTPSAQCVKGR